MLVVNPIISALSDVHGRKPVVLGAVLLSCIPAAVFYKILVEPNMNPIWYYVSLYLQSLLNPIVTCCNSHTTNFLSSNGHIVSRFSTGGL